MSRADCLSALEHTGTRFERYRGPHASELDGVPVLLKSTVGGIEIVQGAGRNVNQILDCRLAVTLAAWAERLRDSGVHRLTHYSVFRPGSRVQGSKRKSGHATGLAIDLAELELGQDASLKVLEDWHYRARGKRPCTDQALRKDANVLRRLVCEAVEEQLFEIVITPHHNQAHRNHVHLEVLPQAQWTFVR